MPYYLYAGIAVPALLLIAAAVFALRKIPKAECAAPGLPEYDPAEAQRAAEVLSEAIRYQTISYPDVTRRDFTQWVGLRRLLRERYPLCHERMTSEAAPGFSQLYRWASPDPAASDPILLCAHLDVVPADGQWRNPPFGGVIEDGTVWGRGALDCKSTVICLFEALESLMSRGFTPSRDIYLALGHDEELGGTEGAKLLARFCAQQGLRFALVLDEGGFISDGVFSVGKPVADICAAEKGIMNIRLTASAPGGHSSRPPKSAAAGQLCEAVCRINFQPRPGRLIPLVLDNLKTIAPWLPKDLRRMIANPRLYMRKLLERLCEDERTAALARTTSVPTMLSGGVAPNVLPSTAEAVMNFRLLPGDSSEELLSWLTALTRDLGITVEVIMEESPSHTAKYKGSAFRELSAAVADVFPGIPAVPGLLCGASDARHYEPFSDAVLRFSPFILTSDELATVHAENERVTVASLGAAVQFYRRVVERFCCNSEADATRTKETDTTRLKPGS